mgnify:CR=1 FL=1
MVYNQTKLEGVKTMFDLMNYANYATGDVLYVIFITAIFFIGVMSLRRFGVENALMASGLLTFIFSAVLASMDLVSVYVALVFGFITAGTYFYSVTTGN